ncbi:hypothetical protein PCASD_03638 [Puccinia coronata f. sp. avenae]|uniref:Uncharacterized protein n=1 Tax=Puccinia coronata f. sp. avenae TaxID=200324 RepID=A0A2N5VDF6_9BASI|nr:hypothetical protein PCASD_03638 [Puccinia coronata f. sp. avenae]
MLSNKSSQQGVTLDVGVNAKTRIEVPSSAETGTAGASTEENLVALTLVPASDELASQFQSQATPQRQSKSAKPKGMASQANPCSKSKKVTITPGEPTVGPSTVEENPDPVALDILGASSPAVAPSSPEHIPSNLAAKAPCDQAEPETGKEGTLTLAMEYEKAGNKDQANMFFRIYEKLISAKINPINKASTVTNDLSPLLSKRTIDHITPELSSSANKRIKRPLFDKWQAAALAYQTKKQPSKSDNNGDKAGRYNGYPYPSKWTLTAGEWERLHRSFSTTLKDIVEQCKATVAKFGKLSFINNPYASGGPRANWDPITGEPRPSKNKSQNSSNNNNNGDSNNNCGGDSSRGRGIQSRDGWSNSCGQRDGYNGGHSSFRDDNTCGRDSNNK